MPCVLELKLEMSDAIALLALLVARLSALYTRWTWSEARRANAISLLGHKKEIYDAFFHLKMHMQQKSRLAELSEVSKFYYQSRNAKIYLTDDLAADIETYYEACLSVADIHRRDGSLTTENGTESKPYMKTERELAPRIEMAILKLLKKTRT